jgi:putative addiction module component (TIGR02574 family)
MSSPDTLLAQALHLSVEERARFVLLLAESLDQQVDPDASEAWAQEIGDRVLALRRGELATIPAAEVFARAEARLQA